MKRIIIPIMALLLIPFLSAAQTLLVSGTVIDKKTGQPLGGASVFCQNTTLGTLTNSNGEFRLSVPAGGYDIVVSYTGFETQSQRIGQQSENLQSLRFVLSEKDKSLEEVSIVVTNEVKDGLAKYGNFFREQFIGLTQNSNSCTIENPETLRFFFSKKKNRLKISAKEDVIINNMALGYRIRYQLDSFTHEYGTGITQYTGYPLFEEMKGSEEQQLTWKKNRETAYYGSLLHFMRAYYDSTLGESGFRLELIDQKTGKKRNINNPYDSSIALVQDNELELKIPGQLRVIYADETPEPLYLQKNKLSPNTSIQISQVDFLNALVIEQNGYYYDQRDLLTEGYWEWEKLADFLPYNYVPEQ
jgi:CarboxypepD_reg-like domain